MILRKAVRPALLLRIKIERGKVSDLLECILYEVICIATAVFRPQEWNVKATEMYKIVMKAFVKYARFI